MIARTHDLAALTLLLAVVGVVQPTNLNLATILLALLFNQIGGIVPDIDQPTAPLWRNLPIGRFFGRLVGGGLGGHRFITHSLVGVALFGFLIRALLGWLTPLLHNADTGYIWWAFMIGLVSHLLMDSLTKEGVPWLLPIPFKFGFPPLRRLRITTGKWGETLLTIPILLILLLVIVSNNYGYLVGLLHHVR